MLCLAHGAPCAAQPQVSNPVEAQPLGAGAPARSNDLAPVALGLAGIMSLVGLALSEARRRRRRRRIEQIVADGIDAFDRRALRYSQLVERYPSLEGPRVAIGDAGGYRGASINVPRDDLAAARDAMASAASAARHIAESEALVNDALAALDARIARFETVDVARGDTVRRVHALSADAAAIRTSIAKGAQDLNTIRAEVPTLSLESERVAYYAAAGQADEVADRAERFVRDFDANDLERIEARARELAPIESAVASVLKGLRAPSERYAALERARAELQKARIAAASTQGADTTPAQAEALRQADQGVDPFAALVALQIAMGARNAAEAEMARIAQADAVSVAPRGFSDATPDTSVFESLGIGGDE